MKSNLRKQYLPAIVCGLFATAQPARPVGGGRAGSPPAASPNKAAEALKQDGAEAGTEAATVTAGSIVQLELPSAFKVKRVLTLPSLNLKDGAGAVLKIMSAPVVSDVRDKKNKKAAAIVCDVQELRELDGKVIAGNSYKWLVPSVAMGNFVKEYSASAEGKAKALELMEAARATESLAETDKLTQQALDAAKVNVVGKVFAVQNMGKRTENQRYNDYNIAELEIPA